MYISSHSPIVNAPLPPCTTCLCIPQLKVEAEKVQMALLLERQHNLLELFGKDTHSQGGHSQLGLLGGGTRAMVTSGRPAADPSGFIRAPWVGARRRIAGGISVG